MKKAKEFALQLLHEFAQQAKNPKILLDSIGDENKESFETSYASNTLHIKAKSSLAAAYAISQLKMGVLSGHFSTWVGKISPLFELRPLWVESDTVCKITSDLSLSFPNFLIDMQKRESFCQRLISLGYNAIVIGKNHSVPLSNQSTLPLEELCHHFHAFGLHVIVKPQLNNKREGLSPLIDEFLKQVPSLDYLFWEATDSYQEFLENAHLKNETFVEALLREIQILEKGLKKSQALIYWLPTGNEALALQQSDWLIQLSNQVDINTRLAFSAVCGNPYADHLPPHPFWQALRQRYFQSSVRFLPIVNLGSVKQGEGLWPTSILDLIDHFLSRCDKKVFAGVIGLTHSVPAEGSILDCNLWIASQYLWQKNSPWLMIETWLLAHRRDWDPISYFQLIKTSREIALELSKIRALSQETGRDTLSFDEARVLVDSVLAKLKLLQLQLEKIEKKRFKKQEKSTLFDYFTFFARDARRIVVHFLQSLNVPGGNVLSADDHLESFWTQSSQASSNGLKGSLQVSFCEKPNSGLKGSRLALIYSENRVF